MLRYLHALTALIIFFCASYVQASEWWIGATWPSGRGDGYVDPDMFVRDLIGSNYCASHDESHSGCRRENLTVAQLAAENAIHDYPTGSNPALLWSRLDTPYGQITAYHDPSCSAGYHPEKTFAGTGWQCAEGEPNPCSGFNGGVSEPQTIDGVELCTWQPTECVGGDILTSTELAQCELSCNSSGGFYASGTGCVENDGSFISQAECTSQGGVLGIVNGTVSCVVGNLDETDGNTDTDGDGIPNQYDDDIDGDGIPNWEDPTVYGDSVISVNQQIVQEIQNTNQILQTLGGVSGGGDTYAADNNAQLVALNERMVALDLNFGNMYTSLEDTRVLIDGYEAQAYQQDSEILNEVIALNTQTNTNLEGINVKLQAIVDDMTQNPDQPIDLSPIETELSEIEAAIVRLETIAQEEQTQNDGDSEALAAIEENTGRTANATEGILGFLTEESEIPAQETDYANISGSLWSGITDAPIVQAITNYEVSYGGAGECPRPSLSVFGETFEITMHCDLYALIAGALSALMYVIWSITAFRVLASV